MRENEEREIMRENEERESRERKTWDIRRKNNTIEHINFLVYKLIKYLLNYCKLSY